MFKTSDITENISKIFKTDRESLTKAVVQGAIAYFGTQQLITSKTYDEAYALVDDIVDGLFTVELKDMLSSMAGYSGVFGAVGAGYLNIGDKVAAAIVKADDVDPTLLTDGAKSAIPMTIGFATALAKIVDFSVLKEVVNS